ncbi:uncharacterized protein LOC129744502 [Uranotaenia lowii]|uniref:uncharacterized protein LOC129744502 n=1 Tax=Uranotaenia lowii TaxID=190385 RepID=UPI00247B298B|nr:uncharacterized protein LOC129744502 [Uranotaenia lowii]
MDKRKKAKLLKIRALREERERLRAELMKHEEQRIQLAIRQTDLMTQWNSISSTQFNAIRRRDEIIQQLLVGEPTLATDEESIRSLVLRTADKAVQTELW